LGGGLGALVGLTVLAAVFLVWKKKKGRNEASLDKEPTRLETGEMESDVEGV
jgi:hypothetical protein